MLVGLKVLNAAFNIISVISQQQLTLFMSFLGLISTRLGLWSVLPKGSEKQQSITIEHNIHNYLDNRQSKEKVPVYSIFCDMFLVIGWFDSQDTPTSKQQHW